MCLLSFLPVTRKPELAWLRPNFWLRPISSSEETEQARVASSPGPESSVSTSWSKWQVVAADLVFRVTSQSVLWGIHPFTVIHDECFFYFGWSISSVVFYTKPMLQDVQIRDQFLSCCYKNNMMNVTEAAWHVAFLFSCWYDSLVFKKEVTPKTIWCYLDWPDILKRGGFLSLLFYCGYSDLSILPKNLIRFEVLAIYREMKQPWFTSSCVCDQWLNTL